MDSWATHTTSPNIKFEDSPTESLLSTPDEMYPSLFGSADAASSATVNPVDMMTPAPTEDENQPDLSMLAGLTSFTQSTLGQPAPESTAGTPEPEKKQVKKRKSWGQVLPEPKTNLPPRKRAKTEDEKEQRRVERVLRNRRAAQSSRERKRLEVEGLERKNKELEAALLQAQQFNMTLLEEIQKIRQGAGLSTSRTAPSFEGLRQAPVTLSQELFGSQDSHGASSLEQLLQSMPSAPHTTVNPASLSPALSPVSEADEEQDDEHAATPVADAPAAPEAVASPDTTQHPAAMLCPDLQCRSAEAPSSASWLAASQRPLPPAMMSLLLLPQLLLASTSAALLFCQRPLMQIAMSMKAGFSLPPTRAMMNTIIWLVTTPYPSRSRTTRRPSTSTSTSSSPTSSTSPPPRPATSNRRSSSSSSTSSPALPSQTRPSSSSLRLRTLRKILTCSPTLARPLMDATMAVLRLVSSEGRSVVRVPGGGDASAAATATAGDDAAAPQQQQLPRRGPVEGWPMGAALPSKEVLLALLWVLRVEERRLQIRAAAKESGTSGVSSKTMAPPVLNNNKATYVLKVSSSLASHKRAREEKGGRASWLKRRRFS